MLQPRAHLHPPPSQQTPPIRMPCSGGTSHQVELTNSQRGMGRAPVTDTLPWGGTLRKNRELAAWVSVPLKRMGKQ